ncbi:MAG TPA: hypothetical protein VGH96_21660 [Streptosporangiaceae bacterium]
MPSPEVPLADLGELPATPDDFWLVDALGRRKLPRVGRDFGSA